MMNNIKPFLAVLISIAVTACGGGGSNSGLATQTIPLIISTTNAQAITAAALKVATGSTFDMFNPVNISTAIVNALSVGGVNSTSCVSGSMDVNINAIIGTGIGTGTVSYNNCINNFGKTINGTVSLINISAMHHTLNPDTLFATVTFHLIVTGLPDVTLTGGYNLNATGINLLTPPIIDATTTATGGSLTFTSSGPNGQTEIISGISFQNDMFPGSNITNPNNFTFSSTILGGAFTYTQGIGLYFSTPSGSLYPHSGEAVVTGGNFTQLHIKVLTDETVLTPDQVTVDLIANGNTSTLAPYTWAQLVPP